MTRLRSFLCVLFGGHYRVLYTAPDLMALKCVWCGQRSPGWQITVKPKPAVDERAQLFKEREARVAIMNARSTPERKPLRFVSAGER